MDKGIIDYEPLNKAIEDVERLIQEYNNEERALIIDHVKARILKERQAHRESEVMARTVDKLPFGLGKAMKRFGKDHGGD